MTATRRVAAAVGCAWALSLAAAPCAHAASVRGSAGFEARLYRDAPQRPQQDRERLQGSGYFNLDVSGESGEALRYDLDLFGRLAPRSSHEASGDVRQATVQWRGERSEWSVGALAETWGVLEAWNPVDIVNQRDLAEDFQGKVKLGQPGATAQLRWDRATLSLYALTAARERRYGEGRDRLAPLPAPLREQRFENGRWSPSLAARGQFRLGAFDLAVSHYRGHSREPLLRPRLGPQGLSGLDAFYARIDQSALEAQYVLGDSVLKAELIRQRNPAESFWGGGLGIETTRSKFAGGTGDLALYAEYYRDRRSEASPTTPFQNDVFVGLRYTCNDAADTVLEARSTYDLDRRSNLLDLRASRRVFGDGVLSLQWLQPLSADDDPALQGLADDTQLKLGFAWYF